MKSIPHPPLTLAPAAEVRLLLGDQLNHHHPWFETPDPQVVYLMAEMRSETDYVRHHVQKVVSFFGAMRLFAHHLSQHGHRVCYLTLDHLENPQSVSGLVRWGLKAFKAGRWAYQEPDEYRLDEELRRLGELLEVPHEVVSTHHFITARHEVASLFEGKKTWLMETFYRRIRQQTGLLMQGPHPEGGQWNYDAENRKPWKRGVNVPTVKGFDRDVAPLVQLLHEMGVDTLGEVPEGLWPHPLTREDALELLNAFLEHGLPHFGDFQDALTDEDPFLFHSRLSFALNVKLLHPLEVCRAVEEAYRGSGGTISLPQAEGFIRQIIGWREYIRGYYWAHMPGLRDANFFGLERKLPTWYWSSKVGMHCVKTAVGHSLKYAYAHHIQRLMVTGNVALLLGVKPADIEQWYLGIYVDALEWVEMPNTLGMSQFADGGILATKPYVSGGAYISRQGDHCGSCRYKVKESVGPDACPLNSLYWNFLDRHRPLLHKNHRMAMMYRTWDGFPEAKKRSLLERAEWVIQNAESL